MTDARLAIHAHFYQPAREDPFTGRVPAEPSAAPFHDWNERVSAECYQPNLDRGNLRGIGWNLGPTLARWLRAEDRALHAGWVKADDGHNGIAQPYHHTILPLASARDRRTEIRWGMRDFELRFGRPSTGIWLPEAAVDRLTLRICFEEGARWTILAPWQTPAGLAGGGAAHARRVDVGSGQMAAIFYDAELSSRVSFDAGATSDADRFLRELVVPRLAAGGGAGGARADDDRRPNIALIATDGELYGHHQRFRDQFLERLLAHHDGTPLVTPGRYMDGLEIRSLEPADVREPTSWSCHHGVARWTDECPDVADGRWKRPLRQAIDRLAAGLDAVVARRLTDFGLDLWPMRDEYVDVASGYAEAGPWLEAWVRARRTARGPRLIASDRAQVLELLRAVASRLQMFASDGWYWGDPRRLETLQTLRFAAHAARLVDGALGTDLEESLVADLAGVRAPDVPDGAIPDLTHLRTGDQLYREALTSIGQPAPHFVTRGG